MNKYKQHFMFRDRVHAQGTKDLFTECARADDKAIKRRLEGGVEETLADIPNFRLSRKPFYLIMAIFFVGLGMANQI